MFYMTVVKGLHAHKNSDQNVIRADSIEQIFQECYKILWALIVVKID